MPRIVRRLTIAASPDDVWGVLADVEGQARWMTDIKEARLLDPGPLRVGQRAEATVRMFGISQTDLIEVAAVIPPSRYAVRHLGRFTGWGEFRLAPAADGSRTRVVWREELRLDPEAIRPPRVLARIGLLARAWRSSASLAARLADPLLAPVFDAVFRADLRRLRAVVLETVRLAGDEPRHGAR